MFEVNNLYCLYTMSSQYQSVEQFIQLKVGVTLSSHTGLDDQARVIAKCTTFHISLLLLLLSSFYFNELV